MKLYSSFKNLLIIFLLLGIASCHKVEPTGQEQVNVLFIAIDDLRPELNLYGASHIKSPNMDALAKRSAVFDRAYCNVAVCGASRASLLTGLRPTQNRFLIYSTRKSEDAPDVSSLPMLFKDNGYQTISYGKVYHHQDDDSLAWDEVWRSKAPTFTHPANMGISEKDDAGFYYEMADVPDSTYTDGQTALKAIEKLRELKQSGKPFFMATGFIKPHLPFVAPKKYWDLYDRSAIHLPDNYKRPESTPKRAFHNFGELRHYDGIPKKGQLEDSVAIRLLHGYYACVSYVDALVGSVLDELKRLDLDKNTVVVLWGDHGWNLGDHQMWCKHCTFESSLHVPLIIKAPGMKATRFASITEYIDIYPSLCDLAGIDPPSHLEGESLIPLMKGEKRKKQYAVSKFKSAVTLIRGDNFYTEWVDKDGAMTDRMLFNHMNDPLELNNLAVLPEYQDSLAVMSADLRKHWGKDFQAPKVSQ